MNKTIIININGMVFHIEEDAYEVLKRYMTDVKRHFIDSADSLEITTDIENRIAEMFNETMARDGKQVIAEQDVKSVIEQMGTVEDFEHAEGEGEIKSPAGFPYAYKEQNRRLFRDPDDHLVAGVCAGVANYFDIDTVWVRLAFAILSVAFASGIFLYIILWIVVPKAVTRADRMAMKGEKLDLQGFKRNFEDELNNIKGHVSNLHHEAKPFIYKSRDFAGDFFGHFGVFLSGAVKLFVKLIGFVILLSCFAAMVGLIVGMVAFIAFGNTGIIHVFPFSIVDREYNTLFFASAFMLLALPLLTIILWIVRLVFDRTVINRSSALTILTLWIGALVVVIYFSAAIAADFKSHESFSQTISIKPTANNTYYLKLNNARYISSRDSERLNIKGHFGGKIILDSYDDDEYDNDHSQNNISIRIEKSDIAKPVLEESFGARGHNEADALANASYITYQFAQADSVLKFDRRLQKVSNHPWRNQEVNLILRVPLNAVLVIDQELNRYLDGTNTHHCDVDGDNNDNDKRTTARFIMTNDGLQCKADTAINISTIKK